MNVRTTSSGAGVDTTRLALRLDRSRRARRVSGVGTARHRYVGLPPCSTLRVGLLPPRRRTPFAQSDFEGLNAGPGGAFLLGSLGAAHLSTPCHQNAGELGPPLLGDQ